MQIGLMQLHGTDLGFHRFSVLRGVLLVGNCGADSKALWYFGQCQVHVARIKFGPDPNSAAGKPLALAVDRPSGA